MAADNAYEWLSADDVANVTERFRADGDVALVTGASRGIGRVTAFQLAAVGADVAIASRSLEDLEAVADELEETFDARAVPIETDIADPDAVERMIETTISELGDLDILVNNAGASFVSDTEDISPNGWDTVVEINLKGTHLCSTAALPYLEDGGRIVNFSSIAGQYGSNTMSHYGAAKAGVENLTRSLANEWAGRGVRVNCIAPGLVLTPGSAGVMGVGSETAHDRSTVDRVVGGADEIADAVVFLATRASSYLTGETIVVEGAPAVSEDFE
ncbi:SDR family oxidoreductase [Natrinema sp. 1APR25-10V2]|uniref:SDR family NAD(P)-dependent oxidoreductase n=1 Tax=Natrinema sp. 1APR25-10V2 TaxID=2951081 RepID=UPI002875BBFB|nr:SDR family oxidoreductase [Natrinema sp. 1APR25-10V2]MDS0476947.1 SDR family oxidoreductase [Natrinema sp. 1APR25-10V2]